MRLDTEGFDPFWAQLLAMCWAEPHLRPTIGEVDRALQMARTDVLKGKSFAAGAGKPVHQPIPRMASQARREEEPPSPRPEPEPAPEPASELEPEPEAVAVPTLEASAEQPKPLPLLPSSSLSSDSPGRVTTAGTPRTPTTPSLMPDFRASQLADTASVVRVTIPSSSTRQTHTDYMVQCTTADQRTWTVPKRFSEFNALRKEVLAVRGVNKIPFPEKRSKLPAALAGRVAEDPAMVKARQRELEAWLIAVLRLAQDDKNLAAFFGRHPDDDEDNDEDERGSVFDEKLDGALAQLRCTPADVLSHSPGALHWGQLQKEGKINRQFKRRVFVLWRDPDAHATAEQTPDGELCSLDAAEEPMHLLYYADVKSMPKGNILLVPGSFTVGVPRRARRSTPHCLRIDGTNLNGVFKLVLAGDDVEVIRQWRVALATRGGMVAETPEVDSVDVDEVEVTAASNGEYKLNFKFEEGQLRMRKTELTLEKPQLGGGLQSVDESRRSGRSEGGGSPEVSAVERAQSVDTSTIAKSPGNRMSGRGSALAKSPSARVLGLEKISGLEKMFSSPRTINFERNDGVMFTLSCTAKSDVEDRTWQIERSFGELAKLRDDLSVSAGINIDTWEHKFPPKRWVPTVVDDDKLIEWCKEVSRWIAVALPVCATNGAMKLFLDPDQPFEPAAAYM